MPCVYLEEGSLRPGVRARFSPGGPPADAAAARRGPHRRRANLRRPHRGGRALGRRTGDRYGQPPALSLGAPARPPGGNPLGISPRALESAAVGPISLDQPRLLDDGVVLVAAPDVLVR